MARPKTVTYWFSADEDNGDVVVKAEIKDDNSVHRYEYTEPDDIKKDMDN